MVGIKRIFILLILCILPLGVAAQNLSDGFVVRQLSQLSLRGEKLSVALHSAQQEQAQQATDSLSKVIYELEQQLSAVNRAIARLEAQQNAKQEEQVAEPTPTTEQESVEQQPEPTPTPEIESVEQQPEPTPTTEQESVEQQPEPTPAPEVVVEEVSQTEVAAEPAESAQQSAEVEIVASDELKSLFNTSSRRYALIEGEIEQLVDNYSKAYKQILASLEGYEKATSLPTLNNHHKEYLSAVELSGKIADSIAHRSDLMLTSKATSYLGFADSLGIDTLRNHYSALVERTELTMSQKLAGRCSDMDLAMYPHRLRNTIELEAMLARYLAPESADSLAKRAKELDTTFTLFSPYGAPKRSDAKFQAVKINKKAKERAVSSLPTIKIPASGELYSITVGNYASLPPSTKVFRGATPLLRERREDGRTYIYIGLYPTARSAQDDIALLRKVGFKQPTLVMWRDGIRRDDFVDRNTTPAAPKAAMWRIEIAGAANVLPQEAMAAIREKAPRKEISKFTNAEGETLYTVGIFTKQSEAQALATAISKAVPALTTSVTQVGKK